MTYEERLRLHLADKGAAWRSEASMTIAVWEEDGPRAVALLPQPLTAAAIVEAYVARPPGARLTLVHEGPLSPVALRSAARFGVTLLDAALLPGLPAAAPSPEPMAPPAEPAFPVDALRADLVPALASAPVEATPELPPPEPTPRLPARLHAPAPVYEPSVDMLAVADDLLLLAPAFEPPAVAEALPVAEVLPIAEAPASVTVETPVAFEPAPVVPEAVVAAEPAAPSTVTVQVAAPGTAAPVVEEGPTLPWDPATPPASLDAPPTLQVTAIELAALPWHAHAPIEEHVEIMAGNPRQRRHVDRPTLAPSLDANAWGLPWPRPVPSTDALSIADPRIWSARERVHAVREDLDARVGAASFGAVKPEGSAWIRRVQTFGPQ